MVSPANLAKLISPGRFATFVTLANGDRRRAVDLYEWTGAVAGALFTDFRTLEVVYRNHIDQAFSDYVASVAPHVQHWTWDSSWIPPQGHWWDKDAREALAAAHKRAGGRKAPRGAVIAEVTFGFWRYIVSGRYEESFWNTALDNVFNNIPGHAPGGRSARRPNQRYAPAWATSWIPATCVIDRDPCTLAAIRCRRRSAMRL